MQTGTTTLAMTDPHTDPAPIARRLGAADANGLIGLDQTSDARFAVGRDGVLAIAASGDRKVELVAFETHMLALVNSALGYPAYYPVHDVKIDRPVEAVLMDLDGTTVRSEAFWVWIIEQATASLLGEADFELEEADLPYVSGHSVSEHLQHCVSKYCPDRTVEEARRYYFEHSRREMAEIIEGRGRVDAFNATPGVKDFLLELQDTGVKIALVTSGLYEKAYPAIVAVFRKLGMGDPREFYDAIITAGYPLGQGEPGTLGELSPKPHPWLYAEAARVGLGIESGRRHHVIGIEDSGAGVCSVRLAGFAAIGIGGGNIASSGTMPLCHAYHETFDEILRMIRSD
jgi:beta-phosphoglucomutase-like phosphatase (HAD superfamily)